MKYPRTQEKLLRGVFLSILLLTSAAYTAVSAQQSDMRRETVAITYPLDQNVSVRFRGTTLEGAERARGAKVGGHRRRPPGSFGGLLARRRGNSPARPAHPFKRHLGFSRACALTCAHNFSKI